MKDNKNILLISNFEKTYWYHKVFYKFFDNKNIYWYVVNQKNFKFLKKYYNHNNIAYINKKNSFNLDIKNELEEDIKLNEILFADRAIKIDIENQIYLKNVETFTYKFLKENNIKFIFGEFTWSYELIISRIAKLLNIPYYNLQSSRYPSNRFMFFSNEKQNLFYLRKNNSELVNYTEHKNKYEDYIKNKNKEKKDMKIIIKKIFKILLDDYYDRYDPTLISKFQRGKNFLFKIINKIRYYFLSKIKKKKLENKKYIIYFLQKSPESTVDVKGMYYSNQVDNIINIWKILPKNFNLIVKEHPNCIGDRHVSFYKKFLNLNDIYLIDLKNNEENEEFMKNSAATFSIASTASLQSALKEINSFTFADTFFNSLKFSHKLTLEDLRNSTNLNHLIDKMQKRPSAVDTHYLKNSFKGYIIEEYFNDENNIKNIREAVNEVINNKN